MKAQSVIPTSVRSARLTCTYMSAGGVAVTTRRLADTHVGGIDSMDATTTPGRVPVRVA